MCINVCNIAIVCGYVDHRLMTVLKIVFVKQMIITQLLIYVVDKMWSGY